MENIKKYAEFIIESNNPSDDDKYMGILLRNNKKFWIGSVNVLDGYIEEVHSYEVAKSNDFHHSFYFSPQQLEKIRNEECVVFWIDISDGSIVSEWRHGRTPTWLINKMKEQIKIVQV
ncbi:MAG: hypothetical protein ACOC3V_03815 [bacterium]